MPYAMGNVVVLYYVIIVVLTSCLSVLKIYLIAGGEAVRPKIVIVKQSWPSV